MKSKHLADIEKILLDAVSQKTFSIAESNCIKYSIEMEESGRFKKIAFDVYRVDNDPYRDMWLLEDIDGTPHLVRASGPKSEREVKSNWTAVSNSRLSDVTLLYKETPIARFSSKEFGFSPEDSFTFKSALLDVITGDDSFVSTIFERQSATKVQALIGTYPELTKFYK